MDESNVEARVEDDDNEDDDAEEKEDAEDWLGHPLHSHAISLANACMARECSVDNTDMVSLLLLPLFLVVPLALPLPLSLFLVVVVVVLVGLLWRGRRERQWVTERGEGRFWRRNR